MKIKLANPNDIEKFLSRLFFLAWQGCGGPIGMGIFQNRPSATEAEVFRNVLTSGDYPSGAFARNQDGGVYGDYVFGRMMKFGANVSGEIISFTDSPFRADYQGFARKYPNVKCLIDATALSLGLKVEQIA